MPTMHTTHACPGACTVVSQGHLLCVQVTSGHWSREGRVRFES